MAAVEYEQWQDGPPAPPPEQMEEITPEYVNLLMAPTEHFLCELEHNIYNIQFVNFKIRCLDAGQERVLFDLGAGDLPSPPPPDIGENACRFIRYHFGPEFLGIQTIGTTLEFTNGEHEVHDFRMIERHYFRDQLITSYDFTMPFVIPNTRNTWEMIYTKPEFSDEWKEALMTSPWEVRSDSFYFVNGRLIMHNRAEYNYGS